jgi:hypothetical protein
MLVAEMFTGLVGVIGIASVLAACVRALWIAKAGGLLSSSTKSRDVKAVFAQNRLDAARRVIHAAVIDFDVPDDKLRELRANARAAYEELRALEAKTGSSTREMESKR